MTADTSAADFRHSPLDAEHRALGAKMVPFGGWDMPLQYRSVIDEHRACREHAVVFDVSHLGSLECGGRGAFDALQWAFTNDLRRISPGRAQYTHLLDPDDAHVVDDIIVWWVTDERFLVMPNASNTDRIRDALGEIGAGEWWLRDVTAERAVLAVQGPEARAIVRAVSAAAATVERFAVAEVEIAGAPCVVAGTGYTGEDGIEIHVPAGAAVAVWKALLAGGAAPAGLGARDTLRLEAGLPLHGHELGEGITPLQAGLGWVVRWDKGEFRGRGALEREREAGPARVLRGLTVEGRQPPRAGCRVLRGDEELGEVTSGNFSPVLGHGIALAFLTPGVDEGADVTVDVRGRMLDAAVVELPFLPG